MKQMTYNDMDFTIVKAAFGWDITRAMAGGEHAVVAAGLFADLPDDDAEARAMALVKSVYPVGVKVIGPDVAHPIRVGNLMIIGPDVGHPNFVHWNTDSSTLRAV